MGMYGQTKCTFPFFCHAKITGTFWYPFRDYRTLKQDFMPNFSQIDEMKWPTKVRRLQTIALNSPQNVSFTKANRMPTSFLLTLTTVKFILESLGWQTSDKFLPQIKSSSNHASFNPVCLQSRIRSISTRIKDSPRLVFFSPYVSAETLGGNFLAIYSHTSLANWILSFLGIPRNS